ncbi:ABC transporter substrate-binding protein [Oceanotoga sp. DSM 15011]|jgi:branched-chain amino acid transport system substrate-binding protein|nr:MULTISPECIES: ABC transporter substrate-binding protein [Oceanotoga]MDN5342961.1 branched-chain amino acid transport system substrate-binding protein [Oceanotoga sp.]MDO7975308.1 ABC transporter substrate-binding protein [Oceanotoga teriensis]UYP00189.1 ABC transporter substrate-binding protein [Oceanotoga sp. DSM 15011]
MKKILGTLMAVLLIVFAFAEVGVTDTEIKIGSFQALSGPIASIGQPMTKGMQAYFNWVNDNGGINGRKINLIVADDQFNPAKTTVEVKRLVESDNVFSIVGGLGTPGVLAVMNYLNESEVPFVYQGSGSSLLSFPAKEYVFPVQPNYKVEGNIIANYFVDKGYKNIALVYRNAEDGKEFADSFEEVLSKNGKKAAISLAINPAADNFATEITKLIGKRPDAVAVMLYGAQAPNFIKQAKQYGLRNQEYVLSYANASVTFIQLAGNAAEGVKTAAWVDVDFENPETPALKIYGKYNNGEIPNAYAVAGLIAAETFTEAVKRAGKDLTRESLVEALETFNNWSGEITNGVTYADFNTERENSRLGKNSMYLLEVKDNIFVNSTDWLYFK